MNRDDEPFADTVYLSASDGKEADLRDVMLETVGKALAQPGSRGFSILQSTADSADFLVVERWSSNAAMTGGAAAAVLGNALAVAADRTVVGSGPDTIRWTRII